MEVGAILERALHACNGSQAELARALRVSDSTVSRWFSAKRGIDYESCLRLAQMTGLPAADVVRAAGKDPSLLPEGNPESPTEGRTELVQLKRVLGEMKRLLDGHPGFSAPASREPADTDDYIYQPTARSFTALVAVGA
jgi:transcriptional regulator with XRE-family HTH domain